MTGARVRLGELIEERYRLDAVAGRGGVGVVHRATDLRSGDAVQVTVLYARIRSVLDAAAVPRLLEAVSGLPADGLAVPLDATALPVPTLVTAPIAGRSLAALIGEAPLPADDVAEIGARLADALAALHERNLVHRLVRPSAIAVREPDGTPVLLDVGVAELLKPQYYTAYERLFGTAAYVSPEQVWNEPVGPASDVYALGLVLIEALTGVPAFPGTTASDAVARTLTPPARPTDVDPAFADLLVRMTAFRPEDRPAAVAAAADLRALAAPPVPATAVLPVAPALLARSAAPPAVARPVVRRRRRRSTPLAMAALALVACAVTAGGSATPAPASRVEQALLPSAAGSSALLNAEVATPGPAGGTTADPTPSRHRSTAVHHPARRPSAAQAESSAPPSTAVAASGSTSSAPSAPAAPVPHRTTTPVPGPRPTITHTATPSPTATPTVTPTPTPTATATPTTTAPAPAGGTASPAPSPAAVR